MVHLGEVRDLVGDDIVDHRFRREHQPPAERQVPRRRAASPAAFGVAHADPRDAPADAARRSRGRGADSSRRRKADQVVAHPARRDARGRRATRISPSTIATGGAAASVSWRMRCGTPQHRHDGALGERHRRRQRREPSRDPAALRVEEARAPALRDAPAAAPARSRARRRRSAAKTRRARGLTRIATGAPSSSAARGDASRRAARPCAGPRQMSSPAVAATVTKASRSRRDLASCVAIRERSGGEPRPRGDPMNAGRRTLAAAWRRLSRLYPATRGRRADRDAVVARDDRRVNGERVNKIADRVQRKRRTTTRSCRSSRAPMPRR